MAKSRVRRAQREEEDEPDMEGVLLAALSYELERIINKPLSIAMLNELESMTRAVRGILQTKVSPESRLLRSEQNGLETVIQGGVWNTDDAPLGAFSPPAETFGATALREILGHLGSKDKSEKLEHIGYEVQQLLRAIQDATDAGEGEIANVLKGRLNKLVGVEPGERLFEVPQSGIGVEDPGTRNKGSEGS